MTRTSATLTILFLSFSTTALAETPPPRERGDLSIGVVGGVGATRIHRQEGSDGTTFAAAANLGVFVNDRLSVEADVWFGRNSLSECYADGSCWNHLATAHQTLTAGARFQATPHLSVFAGPSAVRVPSNVSYFDSQVTVGAVAALRIRLPISNHVAIAGEARYLTYAVEDTAISNLAFMFGAELR